MATSELMDRSSCDVDPSRSACWWDPSGYLRLSPFAVQVLSDAGLLKVDNLVPHRVKTYSTRAEVEDPFSGATFAILKCITGYTSSFGQILVNPVRGVRQNVEAIPVGGFLSRSLDFSRSSFS